MEIIETIPIYTITNVPGWSWLGLLVGILFLVVDILMIGASCIVVFHQKGEYNIFERVIVIFFTCISFIMSYLTTSLCFQNAKEVEVFDHNEYIIETDENTTLGELNQYTILERIDNYTFRVKENNNAE